METDSWVPVKSVFVLLRQTFTGDFYGGNPHFAAAKTTRENPSTVGLRGFRPVDAWPTVRHLSPRAPRCRVIGRFKRQMSGGTRESAPPRPAARKAPLARPFSSRWPVQGHRPYYAEAAAAATRPRGWGDKGEGGRQGHCGSEGGSSSRRARAAGRSRGIGARGSCEVLDRCRGERGRSNWSGS